MKLINWIRKEKVDMERKGEILNIMDITERILARKWDNPQFYFPTYADDHVSSIIRMKLCCGAYYSHTFLKPGRAALLSEQVKKTGFCRYRTLEIATF